MACLPCQARAAAARKAAAPSTASREFTVVTETETREFKSPGEAARYAKAHDGTVHAK